MAKKTETKTETKKTAPKKNNKKKSAKKKKSTKKISMFKSIAKGTLKYGGCAVLGALAMGVAGRLLGGGDVTYTE